MNHPRIAILSHVLPPSPSGQAVMLYRIFSGFVPEDYYLVSREAYKKKGNTHTFLPVEYFEIPAPRLSHFINRLKMPKILRDTCNIFLPLVWRTWKLVRIARRHSTCAIVGCTGDIVDIPAGFLASKILRIDFYAYLFDDYVYQWTGSYRAFAKFVARWIFKYSTGVIGPNEYICEEYASRYNSRYAIVRNPCNADELNLLPFAEWPSEAGRLKIMYTGAIYHANYDCFRNMVQAMRLMDGHAVELHIYTAQTVDELRSQGIEGDGVHIHSHVPYNQILEEQRKADILFLPLAFESPISEVLRTSAPGKMGEYLASGRPVLAHVPANSFVAYYLNKYRCGILANENSPSILAEHILKIIGDAELRRTITQNARQQARLDFAPHISQDRLKFFLSSTMDRRTR